ncbi:uncharacterized protein [Acropora muricata]|uniref:uncharacterized protein isoform X1 n=2 Tax=Acropora muricata TaxID=159855 RepID=UPI0034E43E7C
MSYDISYVKARKKAVKQLRNSSSQQLEAETKKMEDRIRALKKQMFTEKEEREKFGGTRWTSGKAGPLNNHAHDVLKNESPKYDKTPKKLRLLGDKPLENYLRKAAISSQPLNGVHASMCGQCDRNKAVLVCMECAEKYCASCFKSFHQKGALKKHTTQSVDQNEGPQPQGKGINAVNSSAPDPTRIKSPAQGNSRLSQQGGSLLDGSYNEQESAQSFAQALMEWRNTGKSTSCETSTTPELPKRQELQITFGANKSLSYLDRLLLKKRQTSDRTPLEGLQTENQLETNYREIFQDLGAPNKSTVTSVGTSNADLSIEEISAEFASSWEETDACIVEEFLPHSEKDSFDCMTSSGHLLAHVSPRSPSLTEKSWSSHLSKSEKTSSGNDVYVRVWSPKPSYVGLSEFFLAGVADDNPLPNKSVERWTEVRKSLVSTSLSSQNVWKPHESVSRIVVEDSLIQEEKENEPVIPLVLEPSRVHDIPGPGSSTVTLIHDFGIVDFLKIKPNLPSGFEKQSLVHRVSTVSPITLSPNPPSLYWSDDSDDEFLEQICCQTFKDEQKADQDEADRATLTNLAWELASSTGCEVEERRVREESGEEFDQDSIESNDSGSGLSSSEEERDQHDKYSEHLTVESSEDDDNTLASADVHLLD